MKIDRALMEGPRTVSIETADIADGPLQPHEVLLRTQFSMISPGTELAYYSGDQDLGHRHEPYPWNPGYAAVGEVLAAGSEAAVRAGDLVLAHTPHQSAARFDCRRTTCVRVPDGVPAAHAPLARIAQVSSVSIRVMHARYGDTAAVTGLGLVGSCAAQLLRCAGLKVLGVEIMPERRALAERCGIVSIDPRVLDEQGGEAGGAESSRAVVLECSGQARGVLTALRLAARHGEVFLVGAAWKRAEDVSATDMTRTIFNKYLALRSGWEWQLPLYAAGLSGSIAGCTEWVLGCMRDGGLRAEELITDVVSPIHISAAYADLLANPGAHMGVVIDWR